MMNEMLDAIRLQIRRVRETAANIENALIEDVPPMTAAKLLVELSSVNGQLAEMEDAVNEVAET
jgi:hypothetical protein